MGRPSASSCLRIGEESILRANGQCGAKGQMGGTLSTRSIDGQFNPHPLVPPGPAGSRP
jgi:hypothetical protein